MVTETYEMMEKLHQPLQLYNIYIMKRSSLTLHRKVMILKGRAPNIEEMTF